MGFVMNKHQNGLTYLAVGEEANKSFVINNDVVTVVRTIKASDDPSELRARVTWLYDFNDVTREELVTMAVAPMVIKSQTERRKLMTLADAGKRIDNVTTNIRDMLDTKRVRGPVDPMVSATHAITKMSADDRAKLATMLEEMDNE